MLAASTLAIADFIYLLDFICLEFYLLVFYY
jgi:hypothetical protein